VEDRHSARHTIAMKRSLRILPIIFAALLCVVSGACGGSSKSGAPSHAASSAAAVSTSGARSVTNRSAPPPRGAFKGDEDDDETGENLGNGSKDNDADFDNDLKNIEYKGFHDSDDYAIEAFGHAAGTADRQTVTRLVKRYYAAAGRGDGAAACLVIYSTLAATIPEDYGQSPGPSYARGKTCAVVMSKLFKHAHSQMVAPVQVTGVRVKGKEGYVLLGSTSIPAGYIAVKREGRTWKITMLLGGPLP
jgi:hypothetical protein